MAKASRPEMRKYGINVLRFLLCLLIAAQTASLFADQSWVADLLRHFQAQYFLCGTFLLILAFSTRAFLFLLPLALCLGLSGWNLLPLYQKRTTVGDGFGSDSVRIVSLNVFTKSKHYAKVESFILREDPDILFLMEVNDLWLKNIPQIQARFPFSHELPRDDNFGLALLSKTPLHNVAIREFGKPNVPSILAEIELLGKRLHFIGVHTLPPVSRRQSDSRDRLLRDVRIHTELLPSPTMLAGDLNVTRWGSSFSELIRSGKLLNSEDGFGYKPTWFGRDHLITIPIDHILVSNDIIIKNRRVGPDVGSDHRGVVLDFQFARSP